MAKRATLVSPNPFGKLAESDDDPAVPLRLHERVVAAISAAERAGDGASASALARCASAFGDLLRGAGEAAGRPALPENTRGILDEILAL